MTEIHASIDTPFEPADVPMSEHTEIDSSLIMNISLSEIDFDNTEFCFRVDFNLNNLKEDIEVNGQQFPVVLRRQKDVGRYQIISGFRRCNALRELENTEVKAMVRDLGDDEAYYLSYTENDKRKNLSGMDKALAIAKLTARGKSPQEIQRLYGIGERQYYRLKKSVDFPNIIKEAIADEFIQMTHGLVLATSKEQIGTLFDLDEWIDWIIENKASVRNLRTAIRVRYHKQKKRRLLKTTDGGFKLSAFTFDPLKSDLASTDELLSDIKKALDIVEKCRQQLASGHVVK